MIEKVWAIKGREEKVASNGNKYLQVTIAGDDGKDHKQNFYEQGMWAVFKDNDYVKVELDKPEGESRWKVMSAVSAKDAMPQEGGSVEMLTEHKKVIEEAKKEVTPPAYEDSGKDKSFAISYAKDLACNGIIEVGKILTYAEIFNRYMNGDITLKDPSVFDEAVGKHFIEEAHKPKVIEPDDIPY